ncbi:MAG: EthD domain-containing protein [Acidimicrobiales bacterium]
MTACKIAATVVQPDGLSSLATRTSLLQQTGGYVDLREGPAEPGAVVAVVWLRVDAAGEATRTAEAIPFARHAWLVEERPQWDGATAVRGRPVPGVKQVTFLKRAAGIDHQQFATHWSSVHAQLARRHHPALWRYQQNVVLDTLLPGTPDDIDGIAELGMRLRQDFHERMYDSDDGRRIVGQDVRRFLDLRNSWRMMAREHPV